MMSRRNDKEGSGRTRTESGHNDTHETVMRPHAKNGGIAANKSHDKAVILFTFPLTGAAAKVPPPPSFADYANLISPSTRSQWGGGGARKEREREREGVRHATRRRIAQSQSHTPRRGHAPPLSPPPDSSERAGISAARSCSYP